jgi:hypothetical protein
MWLSTVGYIVNRVASVRGNRPILNYAANRTRLRPQAFSFFKRPSFPQPPGKTRPKEMNLSALPWVFTNEHRRGRHPYGDRLSCATPCGPLQTESRNPETDLLAHVPPHLLDPSEKHRNGIQSHAGVIAAFLVAIHDRHLHPGSHSGQTRRASGRILGISRRAALQYLVRRTRKCPAIGSARGAFETRFAGARGTPICVPFAPANTKRTTRNFLILFGVPDGI